MFSLFSYFVANTNYYTIKLVTVEKIAQIPNPLVLSASDFAWRGDLPAKGQILFLDLFVIVADIVLK